MFPDSERPDFRKVYSELAGQLEDVAYNILSSLELGLNFPAKSFTGSHVGMMGNGNRTTLRTGRYPNLQNSGSKEARPHIFPVVLMV